MNCFYNPVNTIQGAGSINKIPDLLNNTSLENKNVLLIAWTEDIFELPFVKEIKDSGYNLSEICFKESNPTVNQLFEVYQDTKSINPSVVIAVGGGSIMDVGKSLCCIYSKEISDVDELRNIIKEKDFCENKTHWIGVPTTAGTGSEVTCWATIWDPEKNIKSSVESKDNYALYAVVDSDLIVEMPKKLAVSSALDAVAHAVESYWAKSTNGVSRALALNAIRLIMSNIDGLIDGDIKSYEKISLGSMMAGMAFSNTKTTACHSISYPLTMHYNIPHGTAVSMLLAPVLKLNQESIEDVKYLFDALGVENADSLALRVNSLLEKVGLPYKLSGWNVEKNNIPNLAKMGITKGRADNNPTDINEEIIITVLNQIF